jgi:hypothetical protein
VNYNPKAHIENNHSKHSLSHAYDGSGKYLGHRSTLNMVAICKLEDMDAEYSSETGTYIVYGARGLNNKVYENVYTQNHVCIGVIESTK